MVYITKYIFKKLIDKNNLLICVCVHQTITSEGGGMEEGRRA